MGRKKSYIVTYESVHLSTCLAMAGLIDSASVELLVSDTHEFQDIKDDINNRTTNRIVGASGDRNDIIPIMMCATNPDRRYPTLTNLPCFYCRLSFKTPPIGCPIRYEKYHQTCDADEPCIEHDHHKHDSTLINVFYVEGNFCSPNCVKAYIYDKLERRIWTYQQSLTLLSCMIGTNADTLIQPSPPVNLQKTWGGIYSDVEYRKMIHSDAGYDTSTLSANRTIHTISAGLNIVQSFIS